MKQNTITQIIHGNSLDVLKTFESNKFDLIVTSPPYNLGKEYENKQTIELYLNSQKEIISELIRVLSPKGNLCWEVGNYVNSSEIYPLDFYYYQIFKDHNLQLRNRIIWHFGHGLHASKRFSGRYETILWFTKTNDYIFNLDNVRIPSKYPGKLHYKGPNKGKPSGNPLGKNPTDIWEIIKTDFENEIWNIPNVKSNHPEKTDHPCQFPIELIERCVLAFTNVNSYILDPFAGVGSSLIAGLKHNRNSIGIEKELSYVNIAKDRINMFKQNKLKTRLIGTPIHKPSKNDKISQIPKEWLAIEK